MIEIARAEEERRLRVLFGPGISPGWPRKRADRLILLRRAARALTPGASLGEREFTALLTGWLCGEASSLGIDAAELRRALVDEGFVERDRAGSAYCRSDRHAARVRFEAESEPLEGDDSARDGEVAP